jgi:tetratricopeptide (TPR) repeat protein
MTATQAESYLEHPMFQKAMQSMQKGDWDSGLNQVEKLMQAYPLEPELRSLRQEMMLRSNVDADEKMDISQTRKRRFRDLTIRFAVVAVLTILAVVVFRTYSNQFQLQAERADQFVRFQAVQTDLFFKMRDAQDYLRAGQPESALVLLEEIAEVDPEYPELDAAMAAAERWKVLDAQYAEALTLIEEDDLTGALVILEEIESQEPFYRDVRSIVIQIQDQTLLGEQLGEADSLFESGEYEEAAEAYYSLYSLNPDYHTSHVEDRLFTSYTNAADGLLNSADTIEATLKVEEYYRKALALRPQDPAVSEKQARIRASIEEKLFRSYVFLAQTALVEESNSLQALITADKYFTRKSA